MRKYVSTITQRGQVTLPADVRRWLGVKPTDQVEFTIEDDQVTVKPVEFTVESVFRSVKPLPEPIDIEDQIRIAKDERAEEFARKMNTEW
ncbi:MAG: AbrB/MazE/SpoVT family DNA-binding domain-containing protein [Chloroflexia bacterium]|jgi:AbrB family looped-hinge helix DNA binding protein|nr:AbrB/MazE/SpoVT family DNA-binding domain-containing protein [Chloroflexia bacterium]